MYTNWPALHCTTGPVGPHFMVRLHVPSTSPFFVPLKNEFNAILWSCLHVTSKKSKVPLTKIIILTVCVNEA